MALQVMLALAMLHPSCALMADKAWFSELWDTRGTGRVQLTLSDVSVRACRRACRMDYDCWSFNMRWDSPGSDTGSCDLLGGKNRYRSESLSGSVFYHTCPYDMDYEATTHTCYSLIHQKTNWTHGMALCRRIHRHSHLVRIRSSLVNQVVSSYTSAQGLSVWTGGRREVEKGIPGPFTWRRNKQDDVEMTYTNFHPETVHTDVTMNCIRVMGLLSSGGQWAVSSCEEPRHVLCQF